MNNLTALDLYKAAALNAYIVKGFGMNEAVMLAQDAAYKMRDKDLERLTFEEESYG